MKIEKNFTYNQLEPLSIQDGETKKANKALNDYYLMGASRSLEKLFKVYIESSNPVVTRLQTLGYWSSKFCWQNRIRDYDEIVNKQVLQNTVSSRQERLKQWEESAWKVSQLLIEKAQAMLESDSDSWTMDTASRFVMAADKIARQAVGEDEAKFRADERQKTFNELMIILQRNLRPEVYDEVVRCLHTFSRLG